MAEFEKLSSEEPAPKPEEEPAGELAPLSPEQPEASEGLAPEPAAKEVVKLSKPSKELAARLLGRVKERVWGMMDHDFDGGIGQRMFSLEEAAEFLQIPEEWHGYTCYIEPGALKKWVDETLDDAELAQAIGELTKEYGDEIELIIPFKELLQQRLKQCKEIAEEATKA